MRGRQLAEQIWVGLTTTPALLVALTAIGLTLALALLLPQSPVPMAEAAAFSRWQAEARSTLGNAAAPLSTLGLLTLRDSLWQRVAMAALTLIIAARLAQLGETWAQRSGFAHLCEITLCLGSALLIVGWGLYLRWGWSETGIRAWPGAELHAPGHNRTLPAISAIHPLNLHGYGLYSIRETLDTGLTVTAWDKADQAVLLTTSAAGELQKNIQLVLGQQISDAYFALPAAGLTFRASLIQDQPNPAILVQIYRFASGELLTETTLSAGGALFTADLRLQLELIPLPRLRVIYNPGAPLSALGWLLIMGSGAGRRLQRRALARAASTPAPIEIESISG